MNPEQLKEFLAKPILMDIATTTPEGYPHVTPVWFEYDGECFFVSTVPATKKAANLRQNPKAGFSIASHQLPYPTVVGYGDVIIEEDRENELIHRLAIRYLPKDIAESYYKDLADAGPRVILKIKPRWILSWNGE